MHPSDKIEKVRALAAEGISTTEISKRLKITRSAICGLAYRHGIKLAGQRKKSGSKKLSPQTPKVGRIPAHTYTPPPRNIASMNRRCVWHECVNTAVEGKPYCPMHMNACHTGSMRLIRKLSDEK